MVFGPNKPSSHFWDVVILLAGIFCITQFQTCQMQRAVEGNRQAIQEILKVEQRQADFIPASAERHEKTQAMLRDMLGRLPETRPATQP